MTWGYGPLVLETIAETEMEFKKFDILDPGQVEHVIDIKAGDLEPNVPIQVFEGGIIKSLAGYTVVFSMVLRETKAVKVDDGSASIVTEAAGTAENDWSGTDTDTEGIYDGEFKFTTGGEDLRVPNGRNHKLTIRVNKALN